jgi:membrane protein YqaA with SNARE-associated domain
VLDFIFASLLESSALPSVGLGAIFLVSALAATILPMGSEPIFLGYLALQPEFFWAAVLVATAGNSLGGFITYWMGAGAHLAVQRWRRPRVDVDGSAVAQPGEPRAVGALVSPVSPSPAQRKIDACPAGAAAKSLTQQTRAQVWVHRFGAPILLLSWLPVVGDPLCAVAGWLRLPWLPCLFFIVIGKFVRYLVLGGVLKLLLS